MLCYLLYRPINQHEYLKSKPIIHPVHAVSYKYKLSRFSTHVDLQHISHHHNRDNAIITQGWLAFLPLLQSVLCQHSQRA